VAGGEQRDSAIEHAKHIPKGLSLLLFGTLYFYLKLKEFRHRQRQLRPEST